MTGDLSTYIVFALGIIVGGVLFSKDFRYKFFKGLRNFLGGLNKGAQNMNRQYSGYRRPMPPTEQDRIVDSQPIVQHVYKRVHHEVDCPTCKGSGRVERKLNPLQEGAPGMKAEILTCPKCNGEGKIWD